MIGRFEPLHNGHTNNIKKAFDLAKHVHFIVGSSFQPRTIKNPFTHTERSSILIEYLKSINKINYTITCLKNHDYNDNLWIKGVQDALSKETGSIAILGYEKDDSSWYLRSFPNWKFESIEGYVEYGSHPIDATKIRELMFEGHLDYVAGAVPESTFNHMKSFVKTEVFKTLVEEYHYVKEYKKTWSVAPYPPTFVTVDAVVLQGGHILLVKRKVAPGKGLWALPGGFLNQSETTKEAMVRELKEETRLKVPSPVILGSVKHEKLFDKPDRSLRGRTLTHAFLVELTGGDNVLPKVKGSDDAAEAEWFSISDISRMGEVLFEDHASIISTMLGYAR
jgi:bifunctional NMN adenylyltransferase/nudix hydrolase